MQSQGDRVVALLSEQYHPKVGGPTYFLDGIAAGLADLGLRVIVIVPGHCDCEMKEGRIVKGNREKASVEVIRVPAEGDIWGKWRRSERRLFAERVRRVLSVGLPVWKPLALHVIYGHYLHRAVCDLSSCPTFWSIYNLPPAESQSWLVGGEGMVSVAQRAWQRVYGLMSGIVNRVRVYISQYDCLIASSEHVAAKLRRVAREKDMEVVGGGVDRMCCEIEELGNESYRTGAADDGLRLLTVAGIVSHKGHHVAVETVKHLVADGLLGTWRFVGPVRDSDYKGWVESVISDSGLEGYVEFGGSKSRDELCREYDEADLYVQPSLEEGFCLTVLEALAHGVPVVGTPVGAIKELVEEGEGRVVPPADAQELARAISEYSQIRWRPEERRCLAQRMRNRHSWEAIASRLVDVYENHQ